MNVPLFDLDAQYRSLASELYAAVLRVLESGSYIAGPELYQFEQEMTQFTGARHAVSTANGTDALILALLACGVSPGDEVITSPYTFFASAEAIARVGAIPVFADIDEHTYNLSPEKVAQKITAKTKAIIPVHIFGQPAEMDAFMDLAGQYGLFVIEDACQALGASYKGRPVGGIGHVGCVSFYPTKNLGAYGDGGMVLTNDERIADRVRLLAFHGMTTKYHHDVVGYNSRLDEMQAALLRVKLRQLEAWNELRFKKAQLYTAALKDSAMIPPYVASDVTHAFHLYVIQSDKREQLASYLSQKDIGTMNYYPCPLHLQKAFTHLGYAPGDLPIAESLCSRVLALPLYPELSQEKQHYVISTILRWRE